MEYKVVNALSRDVEREQLNKILKHISDTMSSVSSRGLTEDQVRLLIAESMPVVSSARPITVTLTGDVTGSGSGITSISIPVDFTGNFIEDAPSDSLPYWRQGGTWQNVPLPLISLAFVESSGMYTYDVDTLTWLLATTSDLPEGNNLYFTEERVLEVIETAREYQRITTDGDIRITSDGNLRICN